MCINQILQIYWTNQVYLALGILAPLLRIVMEPKYYSEVIFHTPIISWEYDCSVVQNFWNTNAFGLFLVRKKHIWIWRSQCETNSQFITSSRGVEYGILIQNRNRKRENPGWGSPWGVKTCQLHTIYHFLGGRRYPTYGHLGWPSILVRHDQSTNLSFWTTIWEILARISKSSKKHTIF